MQTNTNPGTRRSGRVARAALVAFALGLLGGGCADEDLPYGYLADLRIISVVATPLELGPGEEITLEPVVYVPPDAEVTRTEWRLCAFSAGSYGGFDCVTEACEVPLEADADGIVRVDPAAAMAQCLQSLMALSDTGDGDHAGDGLGDVSAEQRPESIELVFRYEIETADGFSRAAVTRIPYWLTNTPPARNRPPVIARVEARPRGEDAEYGPLADVTSVAADDKLDLRVVIDADSIDQYRDEVGDAVDEQPYTTFLASAGRFDSDRGDGLEAETWWQAKALEDGQDAAEIWVVVNDDRGGHAVAGPFHLDIER